MPLLIMQAVNYIIIFIAVSVTSYMVLPNIINISYMIFLFLWISIPYMIMAYNVKRHSKIYNKAVLDFIKILLTISIGLYIIIDIKYVHPDPQGPIAIMIVPILQIIIYLVLCLIISIFNWIFTKK